MGQPLSWLFRAGLLLLFAATLPAEAQIGPNRIFVLDQERLYRDSAFGQRVQRDILARSEEISRENQQLEEALKAEELALTEQRPELDPAEFRVLADAFDKKVETIRTEQARKIADLNRFADEERRRFIELTLPHLVSLAEEIGALALFDTRSAILSSDAINITDRALARIDAEIGADPPRPAPAPETPGPETTAPEPPGAPAEP